MGGHHEARDSRTVSVWRAFWFMLGLSKQRTFGEVTIKFRDGEVVGQMHVQKDLLVEDLPAPTPQQLQDAAKGTGWLP